MIDMSRVRRRLLQLGMLQLALLLAMTGCEGRDCTLIGCTEGLVISFDDSFTAGTTFDIEISEITARPEVVLLMTCAYTPATPGTAGEKLLCQSSAAHSELGKAVQIRDERPSRVSIEISSGGAVVSERTFDVAFTTKEINGPGCGTCTRAAITLGLQ
jgi:hypothetical protein